MVIMGIILIGYGMSQAGDFGNENHYWQMRGSIGIGFLLAVIGGVVAVPKNWK